MTSAWLGFGRSGIDEPKPQADKFRDLARELECDEDKAAFKTKLGKVAKAPRPMKPKDAEAE